MDIYRACDRVFLDTARPFTPRGKAVNQTAPGSGQVSGPGDVDAEARPPGFESRLGHSPAW